MSDKNQVVIYREIKTYEPFTIAAADVMKPADAAKELGVTPSAIAQLMDRAQLPIVRITPNDATQRYTLRSAVETLKKMRGKLYSDIQLVGAL